MKRSCRQFPAFASLVMSFLTLAVVQAMLPIAGAQPASRVALTACTSPALAGASDGGIGAGRLGRAEAADESQ